MTSFACLPPSLPFSTAGFWLRSGMPEPHAFLEAARRERLHSCRTFSKRQLSLAGSWALPAAVAAGDVEAAAAGNKG